MMLCGENSIQETYYDILSVKQDASYNEIRVSYRAAILDSHPDKLQNVVEASYSNNESGGRFLKVHKAWEILSNQKSRAVYDRELEASRRDNIAAEEVSVEDMMVEDVGDDIEFFYDCRCGDYFSIDSSDLRKMGYVLTRDGKNIFLQTGDAIPASVVLPCGSCSLKVRLLFNSYVCVSVGGSL